LLIASLQRLLVFLTEASEVKQNDTVNTVEISSNKSLPKKFSVDTASVDKAAVTVAVTVPLPDETKSMHSKSAVHSAVTEQSSSGQTERSNKSVAHMPSSNAKSTISVIEDETIVKDTHPVILNQLWTYSCALTAGRNVSCLAWNTVNPVRWAYSTNSTVQYVC
jgi:hypothetical protein